MSTKDSIQRSTPPQLLELPFVYSGQPKDEIPPNVSHIQVDDSIQVIPSQAFADLAFLHTVELHQGIHDIGTSAFARCPLLESISIPPRVNMIDTATFGLCASLVDVRLQNGLKVIGDSCFFQCNALKRISIPKTVTQINSNAFCSCHALSHVELQEGLVYILDGAFSGCLSLRNMHIPSTVVDFGSHAFSGSGLVEIALSPKLKSIDESTFQSCKSLAQISIPLTVTTIYLWAFAHCHKLRSITLPEGFLQSIYDGAFTGCKSLEHVQIPSSVLSIGKRSFQNCESLVDIILQEGLTAIGDSAFGRCTSLSSIVLPSTVITIGKLAFHECNRLLGVAIAVDSDMEIGVEMFEYCTNLVTVSIPSSIDYIPEDAFAGCPLFENSKLGSEELPDCLQDRFANLPIHRVCYNPPLDTPIRFSKYPNEYSVDAFGMTPLHLLATCGHGIPDLVSMVLDKFPPDILWMKDNHGKTAMEYWLWNKSPGVVPLIRITLDRMIAAKLGPHCLEEWKRTLTVQAESVATCDFVERSAEYKEFGRLQDQLWKVEVTSILELALWNQKMGPNGKMLEAQARSTSHAICGTDSVIPNVVRFM